MPKTYADGVLRTNQEWDSIRTSFGPVHAIRDARDLKRKPRPQRSRVQAALFDDEAEQHFDAILAE